MIEFVFASFNYWICVILFMIGFYTMIAKHNLIKKVMGFNIVETSVFLLFIAAADVEGGAAPLMVHGTQLYVNPLPHCLMLTGIVVAVCVTAVSMSIIVRIYELYGTLDAEKLRVI